MTRMRNTDYLASMMPGTDPSAVLAYIDSFPIWAQVGWGLGVWGGLAGAVLLLLKSRWATIAFALSFVGALVSLGREMLNPGGPASMHEGPAAVMPYVIILFAAFLLWYSWNAQKKRVLQ